MITHARKKYKIKKYKEKQYNNVKILIPITPKLNLPIINDDTMLLGKSKGNKIKNHDKNICNTYRLVSLSSKHSSYFIKNPLKIKQKIITIQKTFNKPQLISKIITFGKHRYRIISKI